jgi:hypothetical protein
MTGFMEGITASEVYLGEDGRVKSLYCPPSRSMSYEFIVALAKEYAHEHHIDLDILASNIIIEALRQFYPCPRR